MTTTTPPGFTVNFEYGSVKESHSTVKKQLKDGTYKTYTYKQKETSITLQRSRFMQNFIAYNYDKLNILKNNEIADILSKYYQLVNESDKDYSYSPQTVSKFMRYDASTYAKEIEERKILQGNLTRNPPKQTTNIIEVLFPNNNPANQRKFKTLLIASLSTKDFDMRRVRNTDHDINDQDEMDLYCSAIVKGTEFDFKPMITYILRAERFLSDTSSKNIAKDIIMDGRMWLDWFIPHNIYLLLKIIGEYAKNYSIKTKESLPNDFTILIHDYIGIITRICRFLSPYQIDGRAIASDDVLKVILKNISDDLNPYSFNTVQDLSKVDNYNDIDSYKEGTVTRLNNRPINAVGFQ